MTGGLSGNAQDDAIADARRWGFSAEDIGALQLALGEPDTAGVWRENVPAVSAFLAASTQWRVTLSGALKPLWTGLDYAGAKVGIEAAGIAITPDLWLRVTAMEAAALAALNE